MQYLMAKRCPPTPFDINQLHLIVSSRLSQEAREKAAALARQQDAKAGIVTEPANGKLWKRVSQLFAKSLR